MTGLRQAVILMMGNFDVDSVKCSDASPDRGWRNGRELIAGFVLRC